jgi:hypothetical protein
MRLKFSPVALVALSVAFGALSLSTPSLVWAKGGSQKAKADKDGEVPDAIARQFKWEENVVGPNDKKLDRDKIAAMQAAARKEDAAHKNEPKVKKAERPAGVGVPSSSTLPTMDIEKAAPVAARPAKPHPAVEKAPKTRDSLDALLDSEKDTGGGRSHGDGGLGKVLAVGDRTPAAASSPAHDTAAAKNGGGKTRHAAHAH